MILQHNSVGNPYIGIIILYLLLCKNLEDYNAQVAINHITKLIEGVRINYRGGKGIP